MARACSHFILRSLQYTMSFAYLACLNQKRLTIFQKPSDLSLVPDSFEASQFAPIQDQKKNSPKGSLMCSRPTCATWVPNILVENSRNIIPLPSIGGLSTQPRIYSLHQAIPDKSRAASPLPDTFTECTQAQGFAWDYPRHQVYVPQIPDLREKSTASMQRTAEKVDAVFSSATRRRTGSR